MSSSKHPYEALTPDVMLDAVERFGVRCDGTFLALNSYENRVYQVGIEDAEPLIVKFYRPSRWTREAIGEEHQFALDLAELEIPVVAPLSDENQRTLLEYQGFQYALYPRRGGRWPELDDPDTREWLGRFLGRIHALSSVAAFEHRSRVDIESYGDEARAFLVEHDFIPPESRQSYLSAADEALELTRELFARVGTVRSIRLHGDCHPSNILWTPAGPHFVDLDDCRMGPAMQDLWMLLSGDRRERTIQLSDILTGYSEFHDFNPAEIALIEGLRTLRILYYSAWLARRWDDPAFPRNFPWFGNPRYWDDQIETLREQCDQLREPPLKAGW